MKTYTKYFNACMHSLHALWEEVAPNVDVFRRRFLFCCIFIFNIIPSERQDPIIRQDIINGRDECEPAP
jgi:hypothetical protein